MKKLLFFILFILLVGCSKDTLPNISSEFILNNITKKISFDNPIEENLKDQSVAERYGIAPKDIENGVVYYTEDEDKSDKIIIVKASSKDTIENNIYTGRIVSGDQFLCDIEKKSKIWSYFKAYCVDMESAAIGQTCYLNKIPFSIIRSISDNSDENNEYENFFKDSAIKASNILKNMIELID